MVVCENCIPGKTSEQGQTSCIDCHPGTYAAEGASSCSFCDGGQYAPAASPQCIDCLEGKYVSTTGSDSDASRGAAPRLNGSATKSGRPVALPRPGLRRRDPLGGH